jgi:hypothetical protein
MKGRCLLAAVAIGACASLASAASLQAVTALAGGVASTGVPGPCSTYGAPPPIFSFFEASVGISVPAGGLSACGYAGRILTSSAASGPVALADSVGPVLLGNPGFAGTFTGDASALASYKSLGASAHGVETSPGEGSPVALDGAGSAAFFDDVLTITSPHIASLTNGFVRYIFDFHGSLSTPGTPEPFNPGHAGAMLSIRHQGDAALRLVQAASDKGATAIVAGLDEVSGSWIIGTGSLSGSGTYGSTNHGTFVDFDLPVQFGVPLRLQAGLQVWALGTGNADFSSTATLTDVLVFDAEHNPVSEFAISSESGTSYAATPEPSTVVLTLVGLAALALLRRWVTQRRRSAAGTFVNTWPGHRSNECQPA